MGATFSKVIDNIKTKHEVESKPLKDENITHFEFIIEEDIIEESIVSVIPIIVEPIIEEPIIEEPIIEEPVIEVPVIEEPVIEVPVIEVPVVEPIDNIDFEKVVSMDIKDLMKEIIAEALLEEATLPEVVPTVSDRKLRKRRKKSL